MLRYLTAGESHGPALTAILEGMPPGIEVSIEELKQEQARRRWCYGRGGRASIEKDDLQITGGVSRGKTTGAPISVLIPNRDYENWAGKHIPVLVPRPGHADLAGALKYGFSDCRDVLERASARETAARVACGYFAKRLLAASGMEVSSWVTSIGGVEADLPPAPLRMHCAEVIRQLREAAEASPVRCPDPLASLRMIDLVDAVRSAGDTLGGIFEVAVIHMIPGLGSYVHWDRRLDTMISAGVMSINGVKGVEIGEGFVLASKRGSQSHDAIYPVTGHSGPVRPGSTTRASNRAGGIEGGVSNGEPVFIRAAHKPLPMLAAPLASVHMETGEATLAHRERSDVTAVGCAAVIAESMVALALASAWLERFGHDSVERYRTEGWWGV